MCPLVWEKEGMFPKGTQASWSAILDTMPNREIVPDEWFRPDPTKVAASLRGVEAPYWICAGLGLDLFVGRETRNHHDADVAILRTHQLAFREHLHDWDLRIAVGWQDGERVVIEWEPGSEVPESEGAIWCRPERAGPWMFELLINEARDGWWQFKRDPRIRLPLEAIGGERECIPFLNPEIILLHKATSNSYDAGDDRDFETVFGLLDDGKKRWLGEAIAPSHPQHPWLSRLRG